jgi:hypothetical protein
MSLNEVALFKSISKVVGKWAVSGSFAIDMWCAVLRLPLTECTPNNIDIVYSKMTPITNEKIGSYTRVQTSPCTSVTYENSGFTPINFTMSRAGIKYYEVEDIKIMSPTTLLSWYEDEPEKYQEKIALLNEIISLTQEFEFKYMYPKEQTQNDGDNAESPAKRVLLID